VRRSEAKAIAITQQKTPSILRRYSIIAEPDLRSAVSRSGALMAVDRGLKCAERAPYEKQSSEGKVARPLPNVEKSNALISTRP
jgi:hypothetical protein